MSLLPDDARIAKRHWPVERDGLTWQSYIAEGLRAPYYCAEIDGMIDLTATYDRWTLAIGNHRFKWRFSRYEKAMDRAAEISSI